VPVVFGPVHTFDYWGLSDRPAILIGIDVLNVFESVALDFTRGQVHFRLSSSSANRDAADGHVLTGRSPLSNGCLNGVRR
jgi:hypothetical protein